MCKATDQSLMKQTGINRYRAVDHAALICAMLLAASGLGQLLRPEIAVPITGIEGADYRSFAGLAWLALGATFGLSGLFRRRRIVIIASAIACLVQIAALVASIMASPDMIHFLFHGTIAFFVVAVGEVARLTIEAERRSFPASTEPEDTEYQLIEGEHNVEVSPVK